MNCNTIGTSVAPQVCRERHTGPFDAALGNAYFSSVRHICLHSYSPPLHHSISAFPCNKPLLIRYLLSELFLVPSSKHYSVISVFTYSTVKEDDFTRTVATVTVVVSDLLLTRL
jgi:hypothetical protein